ncbi:MAG: DUF5067 domain-containing protein [Clostridia bacterium]|nr:DUF5067 domain-containing protein [Clostridia bacterium]
MKKTVRVILTILIVALFTLMAVASNSSDTSDNSASSNNNSSSQDKASKPEAPDEEGVGILGNYKVEIKSSRLAEDFEGKPVIIVTYGFTNNGENAISFMIALDDEAYQNGVGLNKSYFVDDAAKYSSDNQTKEIRTGVTLDVEVAYELNDAESDVEIEVKEFISLNKKSVTKIFKITD